ncbi:MAG TPA: cytochrome P450, partial [Halieaceae bacterium]|nr:cytochrome P450 [Halieaceae bacterium]
MRESDPVYYIEEFDAWALSRFEDIWQVSMEKTRFTATQGTSPEALLLDPATPPKTFLF